MAERILLLDLFLLVSMLMHFYFPIWNFDLEKINCLAEVEYVPNEEKGNHLRESYESLLDSLTALVASFV